MTLEATITELCSKTRQAAKPLARAGSETRTKMLHTLASVIESDQHEILEANAKDLAYGQSNGLSAAMMDRLKLDDARLAALAASVRDIAKSMIRWAKSPIAGLDRMDSKFNAFVYH